MRCLKITAAVLLGVLSLASLRAQLLVYEGFDYASGQGLTAEGDGTGFSGAWSSYFTPPLVAQSGSLASPGGPLIVAGNSVQADNTANQRQLQGVDRATDLWFSFLLRPESPTLSPGFSGGIFLGRASLPAERFYFGFADDSFVIGSSPATSDWLASSDAIAPTLNDTFLVVGRIDPGALAHLWINPALGTGVPSDSLSLSPGGTLLSGLPLAIPDVLIGGNDASFDELRIGRSFSDVTPIPEPRAAAAFLGLATLMFLQFQRRSGVSKII